MSNTPNMTVFRTEKDKNFTCVSTAIIFDKSISLTARMLMLQMLAVKADSWNVNTEGLCTLLGKGIKAVKNAVAELIQHGYLFKYQVKDEQTKQFGHNQYAFYESPMLNPHFGESAHDEPDFFDLDPSKRKLSDGQEQLLNINPLKIQKSIIKSQSVSDADKVSSEKEKSPEISEDTKQSLAIFYETERILKEMTDFQNMPYNDLREFTETSIKYISEILACGSANPDEIIGQFRAINSAEKSLVPCMRKLKKYCEKSLKNLKYPKAKDSYLKKVIVGFLTRYSPVSAEKKNHDENKLETAMHFGKMLLEMHHPDVNNQNYHSYPFDTQEHFIEYYGKDCLEWNKDDCYIPEKFINNPPTMLNALNFLFSSCFKPDFGSDFNSFSKECVLYITDAVCTKKTGFKQHINPNRIISHINSLNMGFCESGCSLFTFMKSFEKHLKEKIKNYSVKSNYKGYITSMLLSYLCNEYIAKVRIKSAEFEIY